MEKVKKESVLGSYVNRSLKFYIIHPWEYIWDLYREIKTFFDRGHHGYSRCDSWSVDYYLNRIIPGLIRELRLNNNGYPTILVVEDEYQGCKDWEQILLTIEEAFLLNKYLKEDYFFLEDPNYKKDATAEEIIALTEGDDKEFIKYGFELFRIFYNNLWN